MEITDQSFNIVDIKPANMEELTEVGTFSDGLLWYKRLAEVYAFFGTGIGTFYVFSIVEIQLLAFKGL